MRPLAYIILLLTGTGLPAQVDSMQVLTRAMLLQLVTDNHPAVRQANLRDEMGEATVQRARGSFDPQAVASYREKQFEGKDYYALLDAGLKVPTWFGAEVFGGFQENSGEYLDPMDVTPDGGLVKAGVSVPVGQGLFIDRRRADLRKAQAYQDMADAERLQLLNNIHLEVLSDHVAWVAAYRRLEVARLALEQARVRADAVRGSYLGGDRPAIDTLEAVLQVQDRQMRLRDAEVDYQNAGLTLSNHLWDEFLRPLEIGPSLRPDTVDLLPPAEEPVLDTLVAQAMRDHPTLLAVQGRLVQLDVDRRLNSEYLKPQLDLNYSLLARGGAVSSEGLGSAWSTDDRQWGVGFSMPLLLRKERGDLTLAKLRLTEAELGLERERQGIRTAVGRRYNALEALRQQVALGAGMVANYTTLLNGENRRFQAGESSLFLVNQREVALLESRLKQVELEAKLRTAYFSLDRDAGILWRSVQAADAR